MNNSITETERSGDFELVIGLEVHCQLKTETKLFCSCRTSFGDAPNSNTCPVCLALPGALPVCNKEAVRLATIAALALGCQVNLRSQFARKNYFYPDLPKGYQISQFELPIASGGWVPSGGGDGMGVTDSPAIRLTRIHMEEDAGKSVHDRFAGVTAIDLNRAGTPLIEIVSEPEIHSSSMALGYLRNLKQILEYTGVSDANMEEGSLRVDVNVSVRRAGSKALGTRTEIKNLNSFSNVEQAIRLEYARQCEVVSSGDVVVQQTLLWDDVNSQTRPARGKEDSRDYRYFPDPDLPPIELAPDWVDELRNSIPELPAAKRTRFSSEYKLTPAEIAQLTSTVSQARRFEDVASATGDPKKAANWLLGVVTASSNSLGIRVEDHPLSARRLSDLIKLEASGKLSNSAAKQVFELMLEEDSEPLLLARRLGLLKVSDDTQLNPWIDEVIAESPDEWARFVAGESKLIGVMVGRVMKKSGGAADPGKVNQLFASRLAAS